MELVPGAPEKHELILRREFGFEEAFNSAKIYSTENARSVPVAVHAELTGMDAIGVMSLQTG